MNYVSTGEKHVKEVKKFLKSIGFKDVNGGSDFKIGGHQVDVCGGHERSLLIIECTTQKNINSKLDSFRGKLPSIIHGFKQHNIYKHYKYYVPILAIKYQKISEIHLKYAMESKGRKIYIWDNNFINYYKNLINSIGKYAKYNLLAEIGIKPENNEIITYPAFAMNIGPQGRYKLFLFFTEAKKILKFSYVARRELGYETYYQRMIKKRRLKNIVNNYINKNKIFPNSIVVSLDNKCWKFEPIKEEKLQFPNWLEFGKLSIYNNYRSCWIIDGQHRLYSYAHTTVPGYLAISAFAKITEELQANYFLDINIEAKPVDPNLLWDLTGSLQPNSEKGIISNAVKDLYHINEGFFENRIKIPSKGASSSIKKIFSYNNICTSLEKNYLAKEHIPRQYETIKNPLWDKDYKKFKQNIAKEINSFFLFFDKGLKNNIKNLIYTDGFISVLIELYKILLAHLKKRPNKNELKNIFNPLWEYFSLLKEEEIEKIVQGLSSEVGKKSFRNDLLRILQDKYDKEFGIGLIEKEPSLAEKIQELELELNKFVNFILVKNIGEKWYENNKYFNIGNEKKKCLEKSKRYKRPPWEFVNFLTTIHSIILESELWGRFFKEIFISKEGFINKEEFVSVANRLWEYRSNKIGHKRNVPIPYTKDQENITQSGYNIIKKLIEKHMATKEHEGNIL